MRNLLRGLETRLKRLEGQQTVKKSSWWDGFMEQPLPPEACVSGEAEALAKAKQLVEIDPTPVIGLKELAVNGLTPPVNRLECRPSRNGHGHE